MYYLGLQGVLSKFTGWIIFVYRVYYLVSPGGFSTLFNTFEQITRHVTRNPIAVINLNLNALY